MRAAHPAPPGLLGRDALRSVRTRSHSEASGSVNWDSGGLFIAIADADPGIAPVPRAGRAPARAAPIALARGLAPADRLLGLVREGHRLAPARHGPAPALDAARWLLPAECTEGDEQ